MKIRVNTIAFFLAACTLVQPACQKELSCENCKSKENPIANAGSNQLVALPTDSVLLDGSASNDPDGNIIAYHWSKISGPVAGIIDFPDSANTIFTGLDMGVYQIELTVKDNDGLTAKDTVQVIVNDPAINQAPVANAGADQNIIQPADSVTLDGTASFDPDGIIITYNWIYISGSSPAQIRNFQLAKTVAIHLQQGMYKFELTVTDNLGLSAKDTVQVTVSSATGQLACAAGPDQVITLPINTVTLEDGCLPWSYYVATWEWTKIAGPSSFNISHANQSRTDVSDLVEGTYLFELKVTYDGGAPIKDTMQVTVNPIVPIVDCNGLTRPQIAAKLVFIGGLTQTRANMAVAAAGNRIVFAGGTVGGSIPSSRVDILNVGTNSWSIAELSYPTHSAVTAVLNNKIFFAGTHSNGDLSSTVDIFDVVANTWTTTTIPNIAGKGSVIGWVAAAAAGNKVLFVSGNKHAAQPDYTSYTFVEIFDIVTNSWRTDTLHARTHSSPTNYTLTDAAISATTIGNKIYLAGNASDWYAFDFGNMSATIDIYDVSTGTWTGSTLSEKRGGMGAIAAGNKNYWAGGVNTHAVPMWTRLVEIRDMASGTSSFNCLFQENAFCTAVEKNNQLVFFTSLYGSGNAVPNNARNKFDIYDRNTNTWTVGVIPVNIYGASIASLNNTIYVAGGYVNGLLSNMVYKLEF